MAINCPLEYDLLNSRMRTASATEIVEWLTSRSPEALAALSDASKVDPQAVSVSMTGFQSNHLFDEVRNFGVPSLFVYGTNNPALPLPTQEKTDALPQHMHQVNLRSPSFGPEYEGGLGV